jgi:hypothetical protein
MDFGVNLIKRGIQEAFVVKYVLPSGTVILFFLILYSFWIFVDFISWLSQKFFLTLQTFGFSLLNFPREFREQKNKVWFVFLRASSIFFRFCQYVAVLVILTSLLYSSVVILDYFGFPIFDVLEPIFDVLEFYGFFDFLASIPYPEYVADFVSFNFPRVASFVLHFGIALADFSYTSLSNYLLPKRLLV